MPTLRCCVLGATGFIGGHIARAALARGWAVRGVRRQAGAVGALEDIADRIEWVQADLADPVSLVTALQGCPLAFHAAAYYPIKIREPWEAIRHGLTGMRNLLSAAETAGTRRLVYTSSFSTVGPPAAPSHPANEDSLYVPGSVRTPYFEVKWAMEQEAMRAVAEGMGVVVTIPTIVIGPGEAISESSSLLLTIAKRQLRWYVDCTINVVDGRDLGAWHILAAERGKVGRRYILGGHNLAFQEMITTMADAAGVRPPKRRLPLELLERGGRLTARLGLDAAGQFQSIRHWQPLDSTRAHQELGAPEPRPFDRTCRDTLWWFRTHDYLPSLQEGEPATES